MGRNGQGGNGHGGKGDGEGNNNDGHGGGSEGNDNNRLLTVTHLEWWWWFQWQRAPKIVLSQDDMAEWGCCHSVRLADRTAQAMAEEMIKSLVFALADMTEFLRLLDWDEIVSSLGCLLLMLPYLFDVFYGEFPHRMARVGYIMAGAMLALAAVVPMAIMWCLLNWWDCYDREHNDIGNNSLDDDASL